MKFNIAIITSTFLPSIGGSQIGLHVIAKELSLLGHKVVIFVPFKTFIKLRKKKWNLNYKVLPLPPKVFRIYYRFENIGLLLLKVYFQLINIIYRFNYWFANLAYPSGAMLGQLSNYKLFNKNVVLCPGEDIQINKDIAYGMRLDSKIDYIIKKHLIKLKNYVALTDSVQNEYLKLGIKIEKIINIPYGIEETNLVSVSNKDNLRDLYGIDKHSFIFICVGRNHPKKNFKLLPKIAKELNNLTSLDYKILIVGKDVNLLKNSIKNYKLEKYFILIDEIGNKISPNLIFPSIELSNYYKLSDCFLFPSNLETFGIVLAEAMISGLPIITSDAPGCRDVVKDHNHGLIFKREDHLSAAKLMFKILNNRDLLNEYKKKSIKRGKIFNSIEIALQYDKLFNKNI
jgi:glycosyltransferase involved in cell wall biosynthesis